MRSTMQDFPLTIGAILRHGTDGARATPRSSPRPPTGSRSQTYAELGRRAARLANALRSLGITGDQRVGTFLWNNAEHLEAYLAVPSMGAVLHTLNIRLFPEQLVYIANHAEDQVVIVDDSLVAAARQAAAAARDRRARARRRARRGGRRPRLAARARQGGARSTTTCWPTQSEDVRLARGRRARRRRDVLHQRHDRQPEGRGLQPPVDVPALDGGRALRQRRRASTCTTGCCRSCRCSTPTPGAWPTPR